MDIKLSSMDSFVCPLQEKDMRLFTYAELFHQEYTAFRRTQAAIDARSHLLSALLLQIYEIARDYVIESHHEQFMYLSGVLNYINEQYRKKITIDELTNTFYVCKSKLCRDFREYTGQTINNYIIRLRVDHAKEFLLSGASVHDTAEAVGFEYESNFISVFKRVTGITPLQFKRNAGI